MSRFKISRRQLLRGAGGVALALPLLEAMQSDKVASAAPTPTRYILLFGGVSIGDESGGQLVVPSSSGAFSGPLPPGLAPLEPFKKELSIVSGLSIPAGNGAGNTPPGGRYGRASFHDESVGPLLSGMRSPNDININQAQGQSSDFVVAKQIAAGTAFSQLAIRVQAASYGGHVVPVSYKGKQSPIDPYSSPAGLYQALFGSFVPPDENGMPDQAAQIAAAKRGSVLDLVRGDAKRLIDRVGAHDKQRLEAYLEALDELRKKVEVVDPGPVTSVCEKPDPVGPSDGAGGSYGGEDKRAEVFVDLLHMALACDLTRVASVAISEPMSMMVVPADITGIPSNQNKDLHELSHSSTLQNHARGFAWHTKHLARLLEKLKNTPDGAGTFLDSTVVVYVTEGGSGQGAPHNTEGMAVLVAGGKGMIRQGEHIAAQGSHPVQVLVSAMNAVGVPATGLGEVQGNIPALLL
jgi:hypothetical protein